MNTYKSNDCSYVSKYGEISYGFFEDRKSKFHCYLFKVKNFNQAFEFIDKIKNANLDARHVIFLCSVLEDNKLKIKFSDDKEPQGTGTRAIYDIITRENITNICVVIVRYFGGVLLGAGPLARAYLNSYRDCIINLDIEEIVNYREYTLKTSYNNSERIKKILENYEKQNLVIIDNIDFSDSVTYSLRIEVKNFDNIVQNIK